MIFTKKARPVKEPDQQLPSCPETWITGLGVQCAAGNQPFALLGTVGAGFCAARPHPGLSVPVPGKDSEQPILSAPIAALEGIDHPAERMEVLATDALTQAVASLPEDLDPQKVLVLTLLPEKSSARGAALHVERLGEALQGADPRLQWAEFRFAEASKGPTGLLLECCHELAQGCWNAVIFGGVDSLADVVTCTELARQERIMAVGAAEGLTPGEGAAYLVLQNPGTATTGTSFRAQGIIRGATQAAEPHSGKADRNRMTGLAAAAEQALAQAKLCSQQLDAVVLSLGAETSGALEWYQATQKIWPPQKPDDHSQAGEEPAAEELALPPALGECGAAAFALSAALACARFEFEHPPVDHILVCEASDQPLRGALILQEGSAKD